MSAEEARTYGIIDEVLNASARNGAASPADAPQGER